MENSEKSVENRMFLNGAVMATGPDFTFDEVVDGGAKLGVDIFPPVLTYSFTLCPRHTELL
jgi:hypothetical protein